MRQFHDSGYRVLSPCSRSLQSLLTAPAAWSVTSLFDTLSRYTRSFSSSSSDIAPHPDRAAAAAAADADDDAGAAGPPSSGVGRPLRGGSLRSTKHLSWRHTSTAGGRRRGTAAAAAGPPGRRGHLSAGICSPARRSASRPTCSASSAVGRRPCSATCCQILSTSAPNVELIDAARVSRPDGSRPTELRRDDVRREWRRSHLRITLIPVKVVNGH